MVLYIEQEYHMKRICTFIGGSNVRVDNNLRNKIQEELKNVINEDCRHFYCGCFGNFSILSANVLRGLQKESYNISISCYIPILDNAKDYVVQLESTDLYDEIHILNECKLKDLDYFLLSKSSIIIVLQSEKDKNISLISYAVEKHKHIIYI